MSNFIKLYTLNMCNKAIKYMPKRPLKTKLSFLKNWDNLTVFSSYSRILNFNSLILLQTPGVTDVCQHAQLNINFNVSWSHLSQDKGTYWLEFVDMAHSVTLGGRRSSYVSHCACHVEGPPIRLLTSLFSSLLAPWKQGKQFITQ